MRGLEPRWITSSSILHLLLGLIQLLLIVEISYCDFLITSLAPVVQRVDNPIQRKNLFLLDKAIGFQLSFFLKKLGQDGIKCRREFMNLETTEVKQNCLPTIMSTLLWKTVSLTSFQKPQLQSVSILFKFVHECLPFGVLFKPSFNVLSGYFYVSLYLVAVLNVWILKKFVAKPL